MVIYICKDGNKFEELQEIKTSLAYNEDVNNLHKYQGNIAYRISWQFQHIRYIAIVFNVRGKRARHTIYIKRESETSGVSCKATQALKSKTPTCFDL